MEISFATQAYPVLVLQKPFYLVQGLNQHIHALHKKVEHAHSSSTAEEIMLEYF